MTEGNGSGTAKTVKELVLEHDNKLDEIRTELDKAKGAIYLAVLFGALNVIETLLQYAPAVARAASGQ